MHWGKRGPGSPSGRRRRAFSPWNEELEVRQLLATIDLSATPGTSTTAGLGVVTVGKANNSYAGFTVTDVGDVTGSGFDSYVVSAPGLVPPGLSGLPNLTTGGESAAYLIFGSKQVNLSTVSDWLNLASGTNTTGNAQLTGGQRAGDLNELGTLTGVATALNPNPTAQTNPTVFQPLPAMPTTHVYGFNFDGLTLVTGLDTATGLGRNSALGFSVAPLGDINKDGFDDFAISAPNDAGGGKVFIVYGGSALATQPVTAKTVDLEPTPGNNSTTTPTKVVSLSLPGAAAGTDVGYSVAGIGNYINTSTGRDVGIGVPGLTVGGNVNAGAVFAVAGNFLNGLAAGANVDLTTVGNGSNATEGIEYTGVSANALTGFSVSTAGNFDGQIGSGSPIDDLLIGAPGAGFGGQAYLVYATQTFPPNMQLGTTQSLVSLGMVPTTNPVTNPLQGIVISSQNVGDDLGYAVTADDFNSDGVDDLVLGAPGYLTTAGSSTGYVYVIYGLRGTPTTTPARINGIFTITPTAATSGLTATSFIGPPASVTGYSLAASAHIQFGTSSAAQPLDDLLIGSPGSINAGGLVYLVPGTAQGTTVLSLPQMLTNTNTTLNGQVFNASGTADPAIVNGFVTTASGLNLGFGTSVSARNPIIDANTLNTTLDSDAVPDLFFGAPASGLNNTTISNGIRVNAGAAYAIEGGLIGGSSSTPTPPSGGGGGTGVSLFASLAASTLAPPIFTGDLQGLPNPPVSALSHLISYQPLPVQLAFQQFLPAPGFLAREQVAHHPSQRKQAHSAPAGTELNVLAIAHSENPYDKRRLLSPKVNARGKFRVGRPTTYTHKNRVIPASQQTESYPG